MPQTTKTIELHGHRGARGLVAENTLASFREAIRLGVDYIETDIGMSRDGEIVLHHDRALSGTISRRDGIWIKTPVLIKDLTMEQLRAYDVGRLQPGTPYAARYPSQKPVDGARIPALRELLELASNSAIKLNIEIKTSPLAVSETHSPDRIADDLIVQLDKYGFRKRARIQCFDWKPLCHIRELAPDIPLSFLTAASGQPHTIAQQGSIPSPWLAGIDLGNFGGSVPRAIKHLGGQFWAPYFEDVCQHDLDTARALGLAVIVWTVNDAHVMMKLMEMGVDGIITDYPDIGRAAIERFSRDRG